MADLTVDKICLSCSWDVLNDRRIENALTFDDNGGEKQKNDLECIVSLETCVELGTTEPDVPCTVDIKLLPKNVTITEISVVSEARIIEVHGQCGEYLTTAHAEFIDECENMAVYMAEIKVPQPSTEYLLKFARLRNRGKMWLYGIHITVNKTEPSSHTEKTVNFQNVNKILKESGHQLTEKADKCKKFLQMYYTSCRDQSKTQAIPNPQALLRMFEAEYLAQCNPIGSHAKNVSKCFTDLFPGLSPKGKCDSSDEKQTLANNTVSTATPPESAQLTEEIKNYIDQSFSQLENVLLLRIDRKFNELQEKQNEKLDQILHLMQNLQLNGLNKSMHHSDVHTES